MPTTNKWITGLNPEQIQAVKHTNGPLLILAGAGSGKTSVLVSRTGYLLSKKLAKPEDILVLTFTNKAAKELKQRVSLKLGKGKNKIWAGTFHGFGLQILKKYYKEARLPQKFGLIDPTDTRAIIKELLKTRKHCEQENFDTEIIQNTVSDLRANKKLHVSVTEEYRDIADWIYQPYLDKMHSLGVIDFDGLLLKPLEIFKSHPEILTKYQNSIKYLMVDEFQDTNKIQMNLVMSLCNKHQNIAVVGDDDQSIYGWRGAEIKNILSFPKLFKKCTVVRLETNYRSTPEILKTANAIINKNEERHKKVLVPSPFAESGDLPEIFVYETEEEECDEIVQHIKYFKDKGHLNKDIAILFRSNSQGSLLEGTLRRNNIDYDMSGGPSLIDRKEVRDILAYIRGALFPNDISIRRILNTPARGIGDTSIHKIIDYCQVDNISFIKALGLWDKAGVNERTGEQIKYFFYEISELKKSLLSKNNVPYSELLPKIFANNGYQKYVYSSYKDSSTAHRKWQLVEILGRILDGFVTKSNRSEKTIREFLEALELRDISSSEDDKKDNIQLLTFHASKGLEFPVVILMGVDEGLIPHETLGSNISEERRLFYVGVTRAKKNLILTRALKRKRYGKWRSTTASRFLIEIPENLITTYDSGYRPLKKGQRTALLEDLYKKIDSKTNKIRI